MKKILIAGYPEKTTHYENALRRLSAHPITSLHVPSTEEYDALLLPGGGDIDPVLFGQLHNGSREIDSALDRIQLLILKDFIRDKKPVLGICKGMQMLNVFFKGDIIQNLSSHLQHEYIGHDQIHDTQARPSSFLAALYGTHFAVNSAHHQGCGAPGKNLSYVQFASDGVVEGLQHDTLPVLGVQWHPERMCFDLAKETLPDGSVLFSYFLDFLS